MNRLPGALLDDFRQKWERYGAAARTAGLAVDAIDALLNRAGFFPDRVFACSDFVARVCIRRPQLLIDLFDSNDLKHPYTDDTFTGLLGKRLAAVETQSDLGRTLRHFRRREMIRIAWRDLADLADLAETMSDLTNLADACIDGALEFLYRHACREQDLPVSGPGAPPRPVVIAMGKLGGRELNFSSDVDLIFAHSSDTDIDADSFCIRLVRGLIRTLSETTADGIVFRTDMRLRPYGESGSMSMTFDAMESYYQYQGREWERYAWVKARVIAGDKAGGEELVDRLKPFVYRRYLDYGAFESLRRMKRQITQELRRKGLAENVKLGPGGIREIEFFGQAFQLIRGGVEPALQTGSILAILDILTREGLIQTEVYQQLRSAYFFLRRTENRLQEFSDQQTHSLPGDGADRLRLAFAMGYDDWDAFKKDLDGQMQQVHFHFSRLLQSSETDATGDVSESPLDGVWQGPVETGVRHEILADAGFDPPEASLKLLDFLRGDPATRSLSSEGHRRLDILMPLVLREVGRSGQPYENLKRIVDLIRTIERRTCYLALLSENPTALTHLVRLAQASPWIVSFLTRHPVLLDELLDPHTLYEPPVRKDLERELQKRLERLAPDDLEHQIEEMCIFKQINVLRIAAADVTGAVGLMKVSDRLCDIAETILAAVTELAWQHLTLTHGRPVCRLNGYGCDSGFAVIAYGKLGGLELGYDSDLDLVFLHAGDSGTTIGSDRAIDNAQFFARLGQRVVHILTAHTSAGVLYEADMRLRPSGSAGLLVSHARAFRDYQKNKAWTWEHQALVRARFILGDQSLAAHFDHTRRSVLARPRELHTLRREVVEMRGRLRRAQADTDVNQFDLKQGPGGIVDIEFIVQFLVLQKASEIPALLQWTDNVRIIKILADHGVLDSTSAGQLKNAYLALRGAVHRLSLEKRPARVPADRYVEERRHVRVIWQRLIGGT